MNLSFEGALAIDISTTSDTPSALYEFQVTVPASRYKLSAHASGWAVAILPQTYGPMGTVMLTVDGVAVRGASVGQTPINTVGDNWIAWNVGFEEIITLSHGTHTLSLKWACTFPANVHTLSCLAGIDPLGEGAAIVVSPA